MPDECWVLYVVDNGRGEELFNVQGDEVRKKLDCSAESIIYRPVHAFSSECLVLPSDVIREHRY